MIKRINGYICLTLTDVMLAQQSINPAHPKLGPHPFGQLPALQPSAPAAALPPGVGVSADITA